MKCASQKRKYASSLCTCFRKDTNLENEFTFILKNVMLVRRSTVALRSCSFPDAETGKLFLYMFKSRRNELWRESRIVINLSLWNQKYYFCYISKFSMFSFSGKLMQSQFLFFLQNPSNLKMGKLSWKNLHFCVKLWRFNDISKHFSRFTSFFVLSRRKKCILFWDMIFPK